MSEELNQTKEPQELENIGRNPDGTFKDGHKKIEGSGRPKNSLKDYVRRKFNLMSDEEKEAWLKEMKISGIDQWKMGEGQPKQDIDLDAEVTPKVLSIDE